MGVDTVASTFRGRGRRGSDGSAEKGVGLYPNDEPERAEHVVGGLHRKRFTEVRCMTER
jgi:hypothetical protein